MELKRQEARVAPVLPPTPPGSDDPGAGTGFGPMSGVASRSSAPPPHAHAVPASHGSVAARAFCVSVLPRMMPAAIDDAAHWTARGRRRAVWLLCFMVRYAGEDVMPYLPQLLAMLGEASRWE